MFFELVAAVAMGFVGGGSALILRKLSGNRLPAWLIPIAAGGGMLGFAIYSEYAWYDRTREALPPGVEVLTATSEPSLFRPWTYLAPFTTRFTAVDAETAKRNPNLPGQVIADMYFVARWGARAKAPVLVDCVGGRRAALADGAVFDAQGAVADPDWIAMEEGDPLKRALCAAL